MSFFQIKMSSLSFLQTKRVVLESENRYFLEKKECESCDQDCLEKKTNDYSFMV